MPYFDHCFYKEKQDPHRYTFEIPCIRCPKTVYISIPADALFKYQQGELIQKAMPMLTSCQRETLITGICWDCYAEMFPDDG